METLTQELEALRARDVRNIAFYDDALLIDAEHVLLPFLDAARRRGLSGSFHTPNALHARLMTRDLAAHMKGGGVGSFYVGFESSESEWHERTGGKVCSNEFAECVGYLVEAGVDRKAITAYVMLGHPLGSVRSVEDSMREAHSLGIRAMLAEFSPIPETPDGDLCRKWVDIAEPLNHNKTAFPIRLMGNPEVQRLKDACRELNRSLP